MIACLNYRDVSGTELLLNWSDGRRDLLTYRELRYQCPCASCVDEFTGKRRIEGCQVPEDIRPDAIEPVGNYALKIRWNDGHQTGIYAFDYLRSLKPPKHDS